MKGQVKTYLPEKQYGFIKGDDGKDYFFHTSEFKQAADRDRDRVCEAAYVSFDQQATPKGYKAKDCRLLDSTSVASYVVPDEFLTSRTSEIRGWEIIERGEWCVYASSEHSPDDAKFEAIRMARHLGANALGELRYYKTTGSEAGTGRGIHHFTIHNFRGRLLSVAKRNSFGSYRRGDLEGLNKVAAACKADRLQATKRSERKRNVIWLCVGVVALLILILNWHGLPSALHPIPSLLLHPFMILVLLIIGVMFGRSTDYDDWLQRE